MEQMFIESRYIGEIDLDKIDTAALPKKIGLFTTVQYMSFIQEIKKHLEKNGIATILLDSGASYPGQLLGCSIKKFEGIDACLYIGDGKFHPLALAAENDIPVYAFNPLNSQNSKIEKEGISRIKKKMRAGLAKFYSSDSIGILISIKPGQYSPAIAKKVMEKYPDKKYYTLIFDTLDFSQLENFNFIGCFVNTACPRISYDDYMKFNKPIAEASKILGDQY